MTSSVLLKIAKLPLSEQVVHLVGMTSGYEPSKEDSRQIHLKYLFPGIVSWNGCGELYAMADLILATKLPMGIIPYGYLGKAASCGESYYVKRIWLYKVDSDGIIVLQVMFRDEEKS